ncbi:MAG TPA: hypothetical protein VGR82_17685 [Methylomirabilota bacterium]|nr:hypothetical protein [Methylomirabilota bacterium]
MADVLNQMRGLIDAFERRLKQLPAAPAAAPSASTMRSQLPGRSFKNSGGTGARRKSRAWSSSSAPQSTAPSTRPPADIVPCGHCADYCGQNCPCTCHPWNTGARV